MHVEYRGLKLSATSHLNLCSDNLSLSCRGCFNHKPLQRKYVFDATLPPCVFTRHGSCSITFL